MGACSQKNSPLWRRRSEGLPVHGSSAYCLRAAKWQTDVGRADDRQGWHWISPLPHCPNQLSVQELKSLGKPGAYPSLFSDTLQDPRPLPVPVQYSSPTSSHPKAIPTCPHSGKERWVSFASLAQSRLEPWWQVARGGGSKMAAGRNQAAKPRKEKRLRSQLSGRKGTTRRSPPALKGISPELLTCWGWCWAPLHLRARGGEHSSDGHENNPWHS